MKSVVAAACLALAVGFAWGQEESFAPPLRGDHQPIINPVYWDSVRTIMPRAFSALSPQSDPSGKVALKSIRESLMIPETARDALVKQIDETLRVTGPYSSHELVGVASLPRGDRLYRLGYLTYGAKAPALWEVTVYRTDLGWKVLDLSMGTDKIFEKIADAYR